MTKTLAEAIGGARRIIGGPFGSKLTTKDYASSGIPVIRGSNMEVDGRWIGGEFAFVSAEKYDRDLASNSARAGNIIVTQRGTLGQVSIIPDDSAFQQYVVSQSQMAIDVDPSTADRNFVYYYLRSPTFVDHSHTQTIQTGVPHINLGVLREAPSNFPPLDEQREIAAILGALDDKIELNRKTAATLEAMARALYRSWFVDFDPVWAKTEGRSPAHMPPATAALFPDSFGDDGLPVGWTVQPLKSLAKVTMGLSPKGTSYNDQAIGTPLCNGPVEYGDFFLKKAKWTTAPTRLAERGDLIICIRGSTTGRHAFADDQYCLGRGVAGVRGNTGSQEFIDNALLFNMPALLEKTTGSVFPSLSQDDIGNFELTAPGNTSIVTRFCELVRPFRETAWNNIVENQSLATLRDTLLPRLMSGELRVGEARDQVEVVA
ncbi:MAG: restriction endonuclease subunit S [Rhodobacteraceae bacterium]|nr:restriction endonuclease subunit S [Paracoccaceae bacterium]